MRWGGAGPRPGVDSLEDRKKFPAPGWVPDGERAFLFKAFGSALRLAKGRI